MSRRLQPVGVPLCSPDGFFDALAGLLGQFEITVIERGFAEPLGEVVDVVSVLLLNTAQAAHESVDGLARTFTPAFVRSVRSNQVSGRPGAGMNTGLVFFRDFLGWAR